MKKKNKLYAQLMKLLQKTGPYSDIAVLNSFVLLQADVLISMCLQL